MDSLSEHLRLEIAHAVHQVHQAGDPPSLEPTDPVPGCGCVVCLSLQAGADRSEAREVVELLRHLALLPPDAREGTVRDVNAGRSRLGLAPLALPAGTLARLAAQVPGAVRSSRDSEGGQDSGDPLPVEVARRVPILEVARRLGLGDVKRRGREYVVRCPFHDDSDPSLRLNPDKGLFHCFPCATGGDGIELARRALDTEFADAVHWLAGDGVGAVTTRDPRQRTMTGVSP